MIDYARMIGFQMNDSHPSGIFAVWVCPDFCDVPLVRQGSPNTRQPGIVQRLHQQFSRWTINALRTGNRSPKNSRYKSGPRDEVFKRHRDIGGATLSGIPGAKLSSSGTPLSSTASGVNCNTRIIAPVANFG